MQQRFNFIKTTYSLTNQSTIQSTFAALQRHKDQHHEERRGGAAIENVSICESANASADI
jgi:hypothetical protein